MAMLILGPLASGSILIGWGIPYLVDGYLILHLHYSND